MGKVIYLSNQGKSLTMCGIAGFFDSTFRSGGDLKNTARDMAQSLIQRGPDDTGVWEDSSAGVALSHRRLAILDLTEAGHQPMISSCGRYIMVFNGEIYNHLDIRKELQCGNTSITQTWRGQSDTETLLTAVSIWGFEKTLRHLVGMFAVAIWDKQFQSLYLARDRLGEKPLYYGLQKGTLLFGSELKALRAHPDFQGEIDRDVLALYLQRGFVPSPFSIYHEIYKLPPASFVKITASDVSRGRIPEPITYWSLNQVALSGQANIFRGCEEDAVNELERLLKRSISEQMIADVPIGAFLSGGIDSSTVVAMMQTQSTLPVKTFTIGFSESDYDESKHAKAVAKCIGSEHKELFITPDQALDIIPRLSSIYDEPFADVSQIPTILVSEFARKDVTVCLTGDGGDELFGGYNRHINGPSLWRKLNWLPNRTRRGLSRLLAAIPPSQWDSYFSRVSAVLPNKWRYRSAGDKVHKISSMLSAASGDEVYDRLVSQWHMSEQVVSRGISSVLSTKNTFCPAGISELEHRYMLMDTSTYLPDDILVKVDRAAMAASLETRVPILDHRVVEFAWTLPVGMKIKGNQGKWLLRKLLDRHIPSSLTDRSKSGFSVPLDAWLRGPLKAWAAELLDEKKLKHQGYFDPLLIKYKWEEHLQGKRNWAHQLWSVLVFQSWLNEHH
jgi:asparagine synthase (glutamine-hydrolysing)